MAVCYYCMKLQLLRNPANKICGKLRPNEMCVPDNFEAKHERRPILCEWAVLRYMNIEEYEELDRLGAKILRDKI